MHKLVAVCDFCGKQVDIKEQHTPQGWLVITTERHKPQNSLWTGNGLSAEYCSVPCGISALQGMEEKEQS